MGIQDASQKLEQNYQKTGPWAGTVAHKEKGVLGIVSQEKREKTQEIIK